MPTDENRLRQILLTMSRIIEGLENTMTSVGIADSIAKLHAHGERLQTKEV